jgi:hypothetical protein
MMNSPKSHFYIYLSSLLVFLVGCGTDAVQIPVKDHEYVAYFRKVMGKDGTREIEDGPHWEYFPNGRKKFEYVIKDGKLNGIATTWDEDGWITSRLLYREDEVVKDLLAEAKKEGTGIYKVKVAENRKGVTKITQKTDKSKTSKAVQNVTSEATTQAVKTVDARTNAIQPIQKKSGTAVKRVNGNPSVF